MRGFPNRVFISGGYMRVFFTFLLVKWCPFLRNENSQHMPASVYMPLIGPRDCHLSKLQ